jgi:hypothetical protein
VGAPFHLARTKLEWALMLRSRAAPGDRERASELLEHVLSISREYGGAGVERRALEALASV